MVYRGSGLEKGVVRQGQKYLFSYPGIKVEKKRVNSKINLFFFTLSYIGWSGEVGPERPD